MVKICVISATLRTDAVAGDPNANPLVQTRGAAETNNATFKINSVKLYVPVVTLSVNNDTKVLENIEQEFKRTIS